MRISDWSSDVCSSDLKWGCRQVPEVEDGGSNDRHHLQSLLERLCIASMQYSLMTRASRHRNGASCVRSLLPLRATMLRARCHDVGCRSEERRAGKEGVSTVRSRWAPYT